MHRLGAANLAPRSQWITWILLPLMSLLPVYAPAVLVHQHGSGGIHSHVAAVAQMSQRQADNWHARDHGCADTPHREHQEPHPCKVVVLHDTLGSSTTDSGPSIHALVQATMIDLLCGYELHERIIPVSHGFESHQPPRPTDHVRALLRSNHALLV